MRKIYRELLFLFYRKFSKTKFRKIRLKEFSLHLDFKTPGISKMLFLNGTREDDMIGLLKEHIPNFGDIIDCGSNIGFYPILEMYHTNYSQKIVCIEPDIRNVELLKKNISLHGCSRHMVLPIAISSVTGSANLDTSRASNLNYITIEKELKSVQSVELKTIDKLIEDYSLKPSFLRMDIEGHELDVFKGASTWASTARKDSVVLFETHSPMYPSEKSLFESLKKFRENGFFVAALVSSGGFGETLSSKFGLKGGKTIFSDGFERTVFENVEFNLACKLASLNPKLVRYLLLRKQ